jgi:nitric oxide reductase NorE protein
MTVRAPRRETLNRHLPGDGHMWLMVLGDLVIFGAYFIVYMVHRAMTPAEFLASQEHLDVTFGVLNTIVLLTSSLFIARGVLAARGGHPATAIKLFYAAGGCGLIFIMVKVCEWSTELAAGHTVSDPFFSFYYVLTGMHLLHVALGMIILGVCVRELVPPDRRRISLIEQGAIYWHMADLLWIAIFALLYVLR